MPFRSNALYSRRVPRKPAYARKRTSSNLIKSRKLYARYTQPRTVNQTSVYPVKRTYLAATLTTATTFQDGLLQFELRYLPDFAEFTALYDQYRVDKLVFKFIPSANTNVSGLLVEQLLPYVTAIDFDGGSVGLTLAQLISYESAQFTSPYEKKTITVQPRAELLTLDGAAATVSASMAPSTSWWDCSNTAVSFFGVRYGIQAHPSMPGGYGGVMQIWCDVFLTFKNTR